MIILISLILISLILVIFFHMKNCIPVVWEYSPSVYTIRSNGLYLDIDTFFWDKSFQLWKTDTEKLFKSRCLINSIHRARSICNEL